MIAAEVFGFVGGALGTMQALPQVRRVRSLGHGRGVSITSWVLTFTTNAIWLGYGLRIDSPSMVISNVIAGTLSAAVVATLVDARYRAWLLLPVVAVGYVLLSRALSEAALSFVLVALTTSRLPQVRTSWQHYRAGLPSAVSMGTVSLSVVALVCWEAYAVLSDRPLVTLTTSLALALAVAIAVLERSGERTAAPLTVSA